MTNKEYQGTIVGLSLILLVLLVATFVGCVEDEAEVAMPPTEYTDWQESAHGYSYRHVHELGCDAIVVAFDTHMGGVGASIDGFIYSFEFLPPSLQGPDCRVPLDVDSIPSFSQ